MTKLGGEKRTSQTQFEQSCAVDRELSAYKAWVKAEGHLTFSASSVLNTYATETGLDPKIKALMESALGFKR